MFTKMDYLECQPGRRDVKSSSAIRLHDDITSLAASMPDID